MRLNLITFLILLLFSFCNTNAQNKATSADTLKYKFDTVLKGGYTISFKTDDSLQYLYLHKNNSFKLLRSEEKYHPQQLLGLVAADFKDYFVLAQTLHIINPEDPVGFELYKKATGDKVLEGFYIDADAPHNVILMHNSDAKGMVLYNIISKMSEHFPFPAINTQDDRLVNRIRIKTVTLHSLVITYLPDIDSEEKVKTYKR